MEKQDHMHLTSQACRLSGTRDVNKGDHPEGPDNHDERREGCFLCPRDHWKVILLVGSLVFSPQGNVVAERVEGFHLTHNFQEVSRLGKLIDTPAELMDSPEL